MRNDVFVAADDASSSAIAEFDSSRNLKSLKTFTVFDERRLVNEEIVSLLGPTKSPPVACLVCNTPCFHSIVVLRRQMLSKLPTLLQRQIRLGGKGEWMMRHNSGGNIHRLLHGALADRETPNGFFHWTALRKTASVSGRRGQCSHNSGTIQECVCQPLA